MSKKRWPIWVGVALAFLFFSGAGDWMLDIAFYPWARADPPLLDRWVGRLTTGNGDRLDHYHQAALRLFTDPPRRW